MIKYGFKSIVIAVVSAWSQNATLPGIPISPHPTLIHLAVEWPIQGDDNLNGVVTVRYRDQGQSTWRQGLPLRRVPADSNEGFSWSNKHSGSLFDLTTDTPYEIELVLTDPDGGSATQTLTARTRAVPIPMAGAPVKSATPSTLSSVANSAQPGDIIALSPGTYPAFTVPNSGTAGKPIVFRAASGGAVFGGEVRMDGRQHVILSGLTVNAQIKFNNALGVAVERCTVTTARDGIVSFLPGCTDCYIADNVVTGSTGWADSTLGANGANLGEGIVLTGPGNVICHNRVKGFRDCISTTEDAGASNQTCIDIYNNDIEIGADDGIEADFTMGNTRVVRNRLTNCFVGLSSQPSLGGPAYFIRNVMYNVVYSPFKLHRGSIGDVAFHNTSVKCGDALGIYAGITWSRAWFRNNLFIGGQGGGTYGGYGNGLGRVFQASDPDATCSFDYDGFGSIGTGTFSGRIGAATFSSLAQMKSNTSEKHAVEADLSAFAQSIVFPISPFPLKAAPDLRPKTGVVIVDAGEVLANVNESFSGTAPDLGAYEVGEGLLQYGPRPAGGSEIEHQPLALAAPGKVVAVEIYDVRGRRIGGVMGSESEALKFISGRPTGIYFLKLFMENGQGNLHFIGSRARMVIR